MSQDTPAPTETLLGERHVPLSKSRMVHIRPWGIRTGQRIMARIKTVVRVMTAAYGGNLDLETLLAESYDEIVGVVADTTGIPFDDLNSDDYLLEDLLVMVQAIVEVNFTDRPGGGLGKALTNVMGAFENLMGGEEEEKMPSQEPSSS